MKNILSKIINKPTIMVLGGAALASAGLIKLGKASMKCDAIMDKYNNNNEIIEECSKIDDDYSDEDKANDLHINKIQTNVKLATNYGVPMAMIIGGGIMYINGQNMKMRNIINTIENSKVYEF